MNLGIATIAFLVLFPVLVALLLMFVRNDKVRTYVIVAGALIIACGSIFCAIKFISPETHFFTIDKHVSEIISYVTFAIDLCLCVYIIIKGLYYKKPIAIALALIQLALIVYLEFFLANSIQVTNALYIDNFSIIMALIIGIVGSGIIVYGIGYMRVHEDHNDGADRRPTFFAVMFAFLGAMFAIVFSNSLMWMLCAWEVTTVCSFALIGYTRTKEAIDNSFLQIILNLIGGIAFSFALVWVGNFYGIMELSRFIETTLTLSANGIAVITLAPLLLFALAAFTKAAQMPFQNWLLGAMVAPTPTSALLHSSTMVKAGVFLLIKIAPCLGFNIPGTLVMMVGIVTFLFCALAAISQSNAKRVLAYSTISNLGLIVACAGVGSEGAIWAAIFLLVFHAVAKSLLFLCVGTAEHHIGSRNIEDMDDLFERMPRLARLMAIGIMGMFIAPFGMLISKWAALQSFAQSENVILIMLLVFGSAATFMFWAKWLGKILAIANNNAQELEFSVFRSEWASLGLMTVLTVGCCIGFPLISSSVVMPYLEGVFGSASSVIPVGDLWIMAVIALVIAVIFLGFTGNTKKRITPVYLSGVGVDEDARTFRNSFNGVSAATQRNWYMNDLFAEKKMVLIGIVVTLTLLFSSFSFVMQSAALEKDTLVNIKIEQASYKGSIWEERGIDFLTYQQYYEYYKQFWDENSEAITESLGVTSMDELMDLLYMQIFAAGTLNDSQSPDSSMSEGGEQ